MIVLEPTKKVKRWFFSRCHTVDEVRRFRFWKKHRRHQNMIAAAARRKAEKLARKAV